MPAGEVRDTGESKWKAKAWKTKDVIHGQHHKMDGWTYERNHAGPE